jgi:hypothetical protein
MRLDMIRKIIERCDVDIFRLAENADKIWVFDASLFLSFAPKMCGRGGCAIANERGDEALSIPSSLCKIFWSRGLQNYLAPSNPTRIARIAPK